MEDRWLGSDSEPRPTLLHGIPWLTEAVLAQMRARTAGQNLRFRLLKPLRDVNTLQDARVLGLLNS